MALTGLSGIRVVSEEFSSLIEIRFDRLYAGQEQRAGAEHLWDEQSSISYLATPVFLPHLSFTESSLAHSPEARRRSATEEIDVLAIPPTARCLRASIWRDSPSDRGRNYSRVFSRCNLQCTSFWKSAGTFRARLACSSVSFHFHLISFPFYRGKLVSLYCRNKNCLFDSSSIRCHFIDSFFFTLTLVSLLSEKFACTFFLF